MEGLDAKFVAERLREVVADEVRERYFSLMSTPVAIIYRFSIKAASALGLARPSL